MATDRSLIWPHTEVLHWYPAALDCLPDSDSTVLVALENDSKPTWLGSYDGTVWRSASTGGEFDGTVRYWSDMATGPVTKGRL